MTQYKDDAVAAALKALDAIKQARTALSTAIADATNTLNAAELSVQQALADLQSIVEQSPTPTPTATATPTPSPSASVTPTPTSSATPTPSASGTPAPSTSVTPSPTASVTPSPSHTPLPSVTPSPSAAKRTLPVRKRGTTVIDAVAKYGMDTTGKTDVTSKLQAAINALPSDGGTVYVSAGSYLIDAEVTVKLRSNMLLDLDPNAKFYAKSNDNPKYCIFLAQGKQDVEIRGGQLFGDRDTHNYVVIYLSDGVTKSSLSTHEWGYGVKFSGCIGATVNGTKCRNFTGDGFVVAQYNGVLGTDTVIVNVLSDNNRRQGLSITNASGVKVYDSTFSNTNGTSPECGIDIEPDSPNACDNVWIEGCTITGNNKYGLNVFLRISNVTLVDNDFIENVSCGAVTVQVDGIKFLGNRFTRNGATGLFLKSGTTNVEVTNNVFELNYSQQSPKLRTTPIVQPGVVSGTARDVLVQTAAGETVMNTNTYK